MISYPATLRHAKGLAVVLGLLSVLVVSGLLLAGSYLVAILGFTVVGLITWRFRSMRLTFTDRAFKYRGWVREVEFATKDVLKVTRPAAKGWPQDRIYGWSVFEVVTKGEGTRINLLWFGPVASRAFYEFSIVNQLTPNPTVEPTCAKSRAGRLLPR